jgi:hypothetical protein
MEPAAYAEWQPVLEKQVYVHEGPLIHFDGKSIDLRVTPEHKILVRKRIIERHNTAGWKTHWHTLEAQAVYGKHNFEMLRHVSWNGVDIGELVELRGVAFPTDAFLEFLGLYLGDGSCYVNKGGYLIKIAAFKEREQTVGTQILNRLGVRYAATETGYQFFSKPCYEFLHPLGHAHEKFIPTWVKNLPPPRLERLLHGLMNSDSNQQTLTYTTVSPRLADDVQEIIFKAGYAAIVRCVGIPATREYAGHLVQSNYPVYKVRLTKSQLDPKIRPSIHKQALYRGPVYDVTVPGHLVFVRRNGKAVWSGNCWEGYVALETPIVLPKL